MIAPACFVVTIDPPTPDAPPGTVGLVTVLAEDGGRQYRAGFAIRGGGDGGFGFRLIGTAIERFCRSRWSYPCPLPEGIATLFDEVE